MAEEVESYHLSQDESSYTPSSASEIIHDVGPAEPGAGPDQRDRQWAQAIEGSAIHDLMIELYTLGTRIFQHEHHVWRGTMLRGLALGFFRCDDPIQMEKLVVHTSVAFGHLYNSI